jgi:hypothetical protein
LCLFKIAHFYGKLMALALPKRGEPRFYAFDLLWSDGEDLRHLPLTDRKVRLRSVVPERGERLLFCDHIEQDVERLFRLAVEHDLEGVVAKRKSGLYLPDQPMSWLKIRNRQYSQWVGREELFERERGGDPDYRGWDDCVRGCAAVAGLNVWSNLDDLALPTLFVLDSD